MFLICLYVHNGLLLIPFFFLIFFTKKVFLATYVIIRLWAINRLVMNFISKDVILHCLFVVSDLFSFSLGKMRKEKKLM